MTDDRDDSDSINPPSFKVGEVDRLSGFFTPVWESKRRLRAESPIPASSAAAGVPSSAGGAGAREAAQDEGRAREPALDGSGKDAAARSDSSRSDATARSDAARGGASRSDAGARGPAAFVTATPARASRPPLGGRTATAPKVDARGAGARAPALDAARRGAPPRPKSSAAAAPRPSAAARAAQTETADFRGTGSEPPEVATPASPASPRGAALASLDATPVAPASAGAEPAAGTLPQGKSDLEGTTPTAPPIAVRDPVAAARAMGVTVRPVIPMPQTPGRVTPRSKSMTPDPARTPEPLGPLRPTALDEHDPERAAALTTSAPKTRAAQRSLHAAAAASVLHDALRSQLPGDSLETLPRPRETESEREALGAAAARAVAKAPDPYPTHVLRTLRRTLHLSTPLPDAVRAMIDKYRS